ncbi:MAG: class I SAM-dependent methyltransferase [bacterium]
MLYEFPKYYEVLFSFRDIPAEVLFLRQCLETYSKVPVSSILEIACGAAPHAGALMEHGYDYTGLDINRTMLRQARSCWSHSKPRPHLVEADMVRFNLQREFDFVFVMLGSLYLKSSAQMAAHFDSVAAHLRPGGLYFLDMCVEFTDPREMLGQPPVSRTCRDIEVCSRFEVELIDAADNVYEERWTVDINDAGNEFQLQMVERNKAIFPAEFLNFIDHRQDFEFVGWWADWDLSQPITPDSEAGRPVAIIRRLPT